MPKELVGFEPLLKALKRQPEVARKHLTVVVSKSAFRVSDYARKFVPVNTGELLSSIEASARGLSGRVGIKSDRQTIKRGDPSVYWKFLEYGTVKMAARPFVRPAAEAEREHFIDEARAVGPKLERDFR